CVTVCIYLFSDATATTELYTLSLHDALPISGWPAGGWGALVEQGAGHDQRVLGAATGSRVVVAPAPDLVESVALVQSIGALVGRSEEHTSELQSRENLVCRLLLEKKKKKRSI